MDFSYQKIVFLPLSLIYKKILGRRTGILWDDMNHEISKLLLQALSLTLT